MIHQPRTDAFLVNGRSRAPQRLARTGLRDPWIQGALTASALWLGIACIVLAITA